MSIAAGACVLALVGCGSDVPGGHAVTTSTSISTTTTSRAEATAPSSGTASSTAETDAGVTAASTTTTAAVRPTSTTPPNPAALAFLPIGTVTNPVDITFRADDDAFYVVSQDGYIVALRNGRVDDKKLLDISADITSGGEQGLLGLTFSVDGTHAYIDATNRDGNTEITEYRVGADGVFDPSNKRLLLTIDQPFPNHNGGQVRIGPDGYLYIGMGDGGASGDPQRNGLSTTTLLGKILRIDPTPGDSLPYSIPPDNPYVGVAGARPEIWSIGVRNPWRFTFDRATTDLWIADVGQDQWEEIDVAWADQGRGGGANFGWSAFEGNHRFNDDQPSTGAIAPIHEYEHGPLGCSVSGGVRYRGSAIPTLDGWYVYADYCSGQVRAFPVLDDRTAGAEVTLTTLTGVTEVAQGPDGELYVLSLDQGTVYALQRRG